MQTINIVRNIDTNVIEFINGIGQFVDINADFFTIDIATTEWQLPTDGFPKSYLEGITLEMVLKELGTVYSKIDKATKAKVIHRNTAARKKSLLQNAFLGTKSE